jgi:hypothetical protein
VDNDEHRPFDDEPEFDNLDEEEAQQRTQALRIALGVIALIVVTILVILPVLRVLAFDDDADREKGARSARLFVAEQFSVAILELRSTRRATHWVTPGMYERVDQLVAYLQTREEGALDGAERSLARVDCAAVVVERAECFHAWLHRPGEPEILRIRFMVAIVDGAATVVDVSRVLSA